MSNKVFKDSHPRRRKHNHHYSQPGLYFITICTKYRINHFGYIENKKMHLSRFGEIARQYWVEIPEHHLNTKIHEFIIMPDHIHGIIEILFVDAGHGVGAAHGLRLHGFTAKRSDQKLIQVIASFKSAVTKRIGNNGHLFAWQRSFHDRIIRDQREYYYISEYIRKNPELINANESVGEKYP